MSADDPHHEVEQPEDPPTSSAEGPGSARSAELESDDSGPTRDGTRSQLADDVDADRAEGHDPQEDQPGTEARDETEPADYEDRLGGAMNNADPVRLDRLHHGDGSGGEESADSEALELQPSDPPADGQPQLVQDLTLSPALAATAAALAFKRWRANGGG